MLAHAMSLVQLPDHSLDAYSYMYIVGLEPQCENFKVQYFFYFIFIPAPT